MSMKALRYSVTSAGNSLALVALLAALAGCAARPPASDLAAARASAQQAARASEVALGMVGRPYRYGGDTPAGFDCSGLVSYSYAQVGVRASRETRSLRAQGAVVRTADLRRGDLLFFYQEGKKFSHVGLYLGDGRFVHAPSSGGRVRIDRFDAEYWQRHFVEARRI
jgi:cell wall-associated NlpC family hydrolase